MRADLDAADGDVFHGLLTDEERRRADRLRSPILRHRFVVARGHLREMLAGMLDVPTGEVAIDTGLHGKPALAGPPRPTLEFNLSHSGGLALYAFSLHAPVGIDVERVRDDLAWKRIAERFFAPDEAAAITTPDAFFDCWTRKEAILKATGSGLSRPLRDVGAPGEWSVVELHPQPGHRAAVAVAGPANVRLWTWASVHSQR